VRLCLRSWCRLTGTVSKTEGQPWVATVAEKRLLNAMTERRFLDVETKLAQLSEVEKSFAESKPHIKEIQHFRANLKVSLGILEAKIDKTLASYSSLRSRLVHVEAQLFDLHSSQLSQAQQRLLDAERSHHAELDAAGAERGRRPELAPAAAGGGGGAAGAAARSALSELT